MDRDTRLPGEQPEILFSERQGFNILPLAFLVFAVIVASWTIEWVQAVAHGGTGGTAAIWAKARESGVVLLIASAAMCALVLFELLTEVRADGLFIRFRPMIWSFRRIPLDGLVSHEAVAYKPIVEFGGWGIRRRWKKRAYNARGNRGLRLVYDDGTQIVIGSQKPEELDQAVAALLSRRARGREAVRR